MKGRDILSRLEKFIYEKIASASKLTLSVPHNHLLSLDEILKHKQEPEMCSMISIVPFSTELERNKMDSMIKTMSRLKISSHFRSNKSDVRDDKLSEAAILKLVQGT
jgi:hypothetical protein